MDAPDHDLDLMRAFRAGEAAAPVGLKARLEEDLLAVIERDIAESAEAPTPIAASPRRAPRRSWLEGLRRPAMVAGAAACLALGMAVVGDFGTPETTSPTGSAASTQAGANLLDGAASALFGGNATANAAPVVGAIDARETSSEARSAIAGTVEGDGGSARTDVVAQLPRDPAALRALLRSAAADITPDGDRGDRVAFHLAMRWVVDTSQPTDLRAAMLRSLDGIDGIDRAVHGQDSLGRHGIVLSHFDAATGLREQYVVDADGGALIEERSFMSADVDPACPIGTFTAYALYEDGVAVDPAQVPWIAWPVVIPSCAPGANAA